jgi:hypothetical protein
MPLVRLSYYYLLLFTALDNSICTTILNATVVWISTISLSLSLHGIRTILSNGHFFFLFPHGLSCCTWRFFEGLIEITIRLTRKEYSEYVTRGQSMYSKRTRRKITDEEYAKWVFLLGEYYKGQCLSEDAS